MIYTRFHKTKEIINSSHKFYDQNWKMNRITLVSVRLSYEILAETIQRTDMKDMKIGKGLSKENLIQD